MLSEAYAILESAADERLPSISGGFILDSVPGPQDSPIYAEPTSDDDTLAALWDRPE